MAYTLSTNLKLRLDSNLTANAKYNLLKLDELGGVYVPDNTGTVRIRSKVDVQFSANDASLGGLGRGGVVSFGAAGNRLSELLIHSEKITFNGGLTFYDQAAGVTNPKKLTLKYVSDSSGPADTETDVALSLDLNGQNRKLVLSGDLQVSGGLTLQVPGTSNLVLPASGTLVTRDAQETLTNKTIDLRYNQILGLTPAALDSNFILSGGSVIPEFGTQTIKTSGGIRLDGSTYSTTLQAAASGQTGNLTLLLPPDAGKAGQLLATDGLGTLGWYDPTQTGYITSVKGTGLVKLAVVSQELQASINVKDAAKTSVPSPADELLIYNQLEAATRKAAISDIFAMAQFSYAIDWLSGNTFTVAHQLDSVDISVTCYDKATGASFHPDTIQRLDSNTIILTTTDLPPVTGWRVVVMRSGFVNGAGSLVPASPTPLHAVSLTTSLNEFIVSGSSLSSEGTISLTLDTQEQLPNTFWAGPPSGSAGRPSFRTIQPEDLVGVAGRSTHVTWYTSDGDQLVIQHNWGTRNIIVQIMDNMRFENVDGPAMARIDPNTVVITSDAPPPTGGWTVLLQSVI